MQNEKPRGSAGNPRLLVIANETLASGTLRRVIGLAGRDSEVLVVAPALTSRLAFWTCADGNSRRDAEKRLALCLAALRARGFEARGAVGDANPLLAIEDALREFPADHIVVATHPEGRSNWLARDIVTRARARFAQPVHHLIVDTMSDAEGSRHEATRPRRDDRLPHSRQTA
jgi:hypothetical protein